MAYSFFFIFLLSSILSIYMTIPLMWDFFLSFQNLVATQSFKLFFEAKLKEYIYFSISFYNASVFWLQFFFLFVTIVKQFVFNLKLIQALRKSHYCCIIIFSSFIAPSEMFQLILSLIFIFYYEFFIILSLYKIYLNYFN